MSEKWPSAEEVKQMANDIYHTTNASKIRKVDAALRQFATLLRQIEAAGSPVTDAFNETFIHECLCEQHLTKQQDEELSKLLGEWSEMCANFEKLAGAIEALTVERCAQICDRFQARDVGMQPAECAGAIRALLRASERRKGERRAPDALDIAGDACMTRSGTDRRKGEA